MYTANTFRLQVPKYKCLLKHMLNISFIKMLTCSMTVSMQYNREHVQCTYNIEYNACCALYFENKTMTRFADFANSMLIG